MTRIGILVAEFEAKLSEYAEAIESQEYDDAEILKDELSSMYLSILRRAE